MATARQPGLRAAKGIAARRGVARLNVYEFVWMHSLSADDSKALLEDDFDTERTMLKP